jgi:hypothetical protein
VLFLGPVAWFGLTFSWVVEEGLYCYCIAIFAAVRQESHSHQTTDLLHQRWCNQALPCRAWPQGIGCLWTSVLLSVLLVCSGRHLLLNTSFCGEVSWNLLGANTDTCLLLSYRGEGVTELRCEAAQIAGTLVICSTPGSLLGPL